MDNYKTKLDIIQNLERFRIMKELRCKICNVYLGNIEKGKLHKSAAILCNGCFDKYKVLEDLENYKKGTSNSNNKNPIDIPPFLQDLLDGKIKQHTLNNMYTKEKIYNEVENKVRNEVDNEVENEVVESIH